MRVDVHIRGKCPARAPRSLKRDREHDAAAPSRQIYLAFPALEVDAMPRKNAIAPVGDGRRMLTYLDADWEVTGTRYEDDAVPRPDDTGREAARCRTLALAIQIDGAYVKRLPRRVCQ